jgi:transcriptional regulator with XRE-family HTH domain
MLLGERLRKLRVEKSLRQSDVEQRSGLLRCYISRVEHGYTVPSLETLERMARALEVPMYRLFYEGECQPEVPMFQPAYPSEWGSSGADAEFLRRFRAYIGKASLRNRQVLLAMADHMAREESRAAIRRRCF